MNKTVLFFLAISLILFSCERNNSDHYSNPILIISENLVYSYNDFELYDSSTHMLYFKTVQPEIVNPEQLSFEFYADTIKIYQGKYWSGFQSSFPSDPFVTKHPFFYPNYVMRFEYVGQGNDPRNDYRLISAFKNCGLLHSGLSAEIKEIDINGSQLSFSFIVTNKDKSDLLILDPEKMGPNLFHYFTNAPVFFNTSQKKVYSCSIEFQSPASGNTWESGWLSVLRSGASRQFTFNYTVDLPFASGIYKVSYEFPGLSHQISRDQLYQSNKRIWLGDILMTKRMTIH